MIDNQFRPTPSSKLLPAVFDAIDAAGVTDVRVCCANGKVFPMSESDTEQKVGRENLARMERNGWSFSQNDPQNADAYTYVGVSSGGTPVWLLNEVARRELKITIGQAQANHWGAGGGGKLILPGVVSDETVESNHCAFVTSPQTHYGAYCRPDALRHRRGRVDVRARLHDERPARHARPRDRRRLRLAPRGAPRGDPRASTRSTRTSRSCPSTARRTSRSAASSHPPTTSSSTRAGAACPPTSWSRTAARSSTASPSPGVSTAIGDFPGLALMDLMKPYMPPTPENYQRVLRDIHARAIQMWAGCIWVPIYEVMTRKHLTVVTLEENLEMAADIGIDATTSIDEALAAAFERHGADAKVVVLPYARYQLPRNAVRMEHADRARVRPRGRVVDDGRRAPHDPGPRASGVVAARAPPARSAARRRSSSCSGSSRTGAPRS